MAAVALTAVVVSFNVLCSSFSTCGVSSSISRGHENISGRACCTREVAA